MQDLFYTGLYKFDDAVKDLKRITQSYANIGDGEIPPLTDTTVKTPVDEKPSTVVPFKRKE